MTVASYVALRASPADTAPTWWDAARQRRDAPLPIAALLRGRQRVEVTPDDAARALAWAGSLAGWATADPKPVVLYQPALAAADS
jgi:hypothetical protein